MDQFLGGPAGMRGIPGGRLTLVSGQPILRGNQTAKTRIYLTPFESDQSPLMSAEGWVLASFGEPFADLDTSNQLAEKVYDVFGYNAAGTYTLGIGPAWVNTATVTMTIATPAVITWNAHGLNEGDPVIFTTSGALPTGIVAGTTYYVAKSPGANTFNVSTSVANAAAGTLVATSGSQSGTHTGTNNTRLRGTGTGTTELEMVNGLLVNKNAITLKNGAGGGVSVGPRLAIFLGSFYCTANGQTGMNFQPAGAAGGANPWLALSNAYHRRPAMVENQDSTSSWPYNSTTWRGSNGSVLNRVNWLDCLGYSHVRAKFFQTASSEVGGNSYVGLNFNNTNGTPRSFSVGITNLYMSHTVLADALPTLGPGYCQSMEKSTANRSFFGTNADTVMLHQAELEM